MGLRDQAAPGKTRSSAYFAAPVSFEGPSRRSGAEPRARPGTIVPGSMTTAPDGSVRVVRSGTGQPSWRLTLSPGPEPEALLATAFGLAAAIPAVVIYNVFARSIGGYRALLGDTSAEVLRLVSRDLDRGTSLRAHIPAAAE